MAERMTQDPPGRALFRAVQQKRPAAGLIHHSDRGSQYCSHDYRNLLEQFVMNASMSRRGNCYDKAPMESFWGSLKNELVHHVVTQLGQRLKPLSESTLRYFITANGAIRASALLRRPCSSRISADSRQSLELGVSIVDRTRQYLSECPVQIFSN
jgi:transposase InsO family protein